MFHQLPRLLRRTRLRRTPHLLLTAIATVALAAAACGSNDTGAGGTNPDGSPSPVTLRLGIFPNVTHAPAFITLSDGFLDAELPEHVSLNTLAFNAGGQVIEAIFANEIDISFIGPNPAINGFVRSNGEALRIVSGATSGGALFIVHPESGIQTAADLSGKRLATPALGNTQDVALRAYLAEHGLAAREQGGNVNVIPTANPDILTLFIRGDMDGAWVPEPWGTRLIQEAGGELFLDERDLWPDGDFVTTHVIVRTGFLEQHPDVVEAFVRAHVRGIQYMNENTEDAKTIANAGIAGITVALPDQVIDGAWPNLRFTPDPIASSLQRSADDAYALGYLDVEPNLEGIYALDILNRVLADLGLDPVQE